jgi:nitrous oxidase accessory protein
LKIILTILLIFAFFCSFSRTIAAGKGYAINTLRKAVEAANAGDTILLHKGIYKEGNIIINKSIHLIGIEQPVLDGEGKDEILTVSGQNITIKGIHFINSGYSSMYDYAALKIINSNHVVVEYNVSNGSYFGIHFSNTSFAVVRNNKLKSTPKTEQTSGNGIHLWKCTNMVVKDNYIEGHRDGIYFEFVTNSVIQNNVSTRNLRYGLHFMFSNNDVYINNTFKENGAGVAVMFSNKVYMHYNHFEYNWGPSSYGLLLKEISDSRITRNQFDQNSTAVHMEGTNRIEVQHNQFKSNGWAIRVQASCSDNSFHHNNFFGNTFDVATNGATMLNRFYNNYWDKYEGYDMSRDGFGDVPYRPISMYSMVIEQNPTALMLLRSFMVALLDRAEKAIPSLTPENLLDEHPLMKPLPL